MKRIMVLLFVGACAAWGVFDYSKRLDAQLLDHVKKVIPLIADGWNTKTLEHDAGPELIQNRVHWTQRSSFIPSSESYGIVTTRS